MGQVRDDLQGYVMEHLGDPGGVLVVDETGFLKQGQACCPNRSSCSGVGAKATLWARFPTYPNRESCRAVPTTDPSPSLASASSSCLLRWLRLPYSLAENTVMISRTSWANSSSKLGCSP